MKLIPTQDGLIGFPAWIGQIANSDGVVVVPTIAGDVVPGNAVRPGFVSFTLSVTGSLNNVVTFMDDIESKSPGYLLNIDSLDLIQSGTGYTLKAQGRAFSL
jgi:hypothetical protein